MRKWLTVIEVAKLADQHLGDIEKARDWRDLQRVHSEVSSALYEETDGGECNPQQVAIYQDILNLMFVAALSANAEWPPRHSISDGQRQKLAQLKDLIAERLQDWEPLSEALQSSAAPDTASSVRDGDLTE